MPGPNEVEYAVVDKRKPSSKDMGSGVYMDPEKCTDEPTGQKANNAVVNPGYEDIGTITIPGSEEVEYESVDKREPSSDDMGSGVYMDPAKYSDKPTGQKASHDMENPGYDAISTVILPKDNTSTPPSHYQSIKKPEQEHYQSLDKPKGQYQSLHKPEQEGYQSLKKPEQELYQDLKKPNPEDMGSGDYADPEKYTGLPAFTKDNKEIGNEEQNLDDREYFTLEPPNSGDEDNNATLEAANGFDDREYFTLEPPNSGDEDNDGPSDAANGIDDREYFTLEPPNSGDEDSDGAADAANGFEDREYFILEPPGDDDENVKTGQEEIREYSIPPDAQ
ncbi:uncharacterized protein [Amphiura filiformis]|uniref:uncharacterized protein n=1 Tax=Amphiura filiformis TaxID=82378 RepID=UPI003B20E4B9